MVSRPPPAVSRALLALGAWLALYELNVIFAFTAEAGVVFGRPAHLVISFAAAAVCLAGAVRRRGAERVAWVLVALGIVGWNAGDTYWTTVLLDQSEIPVPSWADAGYLAFPVLMFVAVALLMRPTVDLASRMLLADGVAAGLAVGAVAVVLVVGDVFDAEAESVAVNLAYAVSDLVLLGLVVGAVAIRGWHFDRMWALVGAAVAAFWIADTSYLVAIADGSYTFPGVLDVGWSACFLLLAGAAWQPAGEAVAVERLRRRVALLPLGFAALALGVLAEAAFSGGSQPGVVLAVGSLLAVGVRLWVTFDAHAGMLELSRHEALTDPLTGLGNRRALMAHLHRAVAQAHAAAPEVLVLYDLDGFKHYNDSFGHPAGDALLARLGQRLTEQVEPDASAYRIGGDEFCVLATLDGRSPEAVARAGAAALSDEGSGFRIGASFGTVVLPQDTDVSEQALRVADQRMYAQKHGGRASAGRQVSDVLVTALVERDGHLGEHVRDVAALATAVARGLGMDDEQCEQIGHAAMLHDVGKVAIPDAILDKPGPLDESEWAFLRRHTIVGERIIGAAPAMRGVADVVRSSHERWDGAGYPDGLAREEIPLGARIVAVCDAYDAMRTARPYSSARPEAEVLEELRRCRGSQFDPGIVELFCRQRLAIAAESSPTPVG